MSCPRPSRPPTWSGLAAADPRDLPLYGIPFAIKDNIDLAGIPTTAACPAFAYTPQRSAHVVQRLIAAGAIPVGKTNLDQFATGLVGTRSPYGAVPQRLRPGLHRRRLQLGLGGGGGAGAGELLPRHRHRRLRSGAGGLQQPGRPQADPRA